MLPIIPNEDMEQIITQMQQYNTSPCKSQGIFLDEQSQQCTLNDYEISTINDYYALQSDGSFIPASSRLGFEPVRTFLSKHNRFDDALKTLQQYSKEQGLYCAKQPERGTPCGIIITDKISGDVISLMPYEEANIDEPQYYRPAMNRIEETRQKMGILFQ